MRTQKLGGRTWAVILLAGLVGQLAWTIENMYFNVYLYNTISTDPAWIANMVAASAAAATLTTLLMGALSDRLARRKPFIAGGYILWGLSTMAFGYITVENAARWFPAANAAAAAAGLVVVMDCIMTFFGSAANDAAFNAYVTEVTGAGNRGRVESVLAVLPLVSMLVIFGGFDGMTRAGRWRAFFTLFGLLMTLTGLVCALLVKEPPHAQSAGNYFGSIVCGFRPSVVRANPGLHTALCALLVFSVSVQVFFPYLIIYMQEYLGLENYALVLGIVLLAASAVSVLSGGLIDRVGKLRVVLPAAGIMLAGLVAMYFVRSFWFVIGAGIVMMAGYMLMAAILGGLVRDYTPAGRAGGFQGIRMIFAVLLPMLTGPYIGAAVIKNSAQTYVELGVVKQVPTPGVFLAAAAVLALVAIPVGMLQKREGGR